MRLAAALAAAAVAVICAGCGQTEGLSHKAFRGKLLDPAVPAPDFALHDQSGAPVTLAGEQGHYFVVTFLYTHCPDVCPAIAGTLNRVLQTPAAHRAGLRVLAVTVDPKGDTPAAVRGFIRQHGLGPSFRYLTGTHAELAHTWKGFQVAVLPGAGGTVAHSSFEILVDPQGRQRLIFDSTATAGAIVHDLNQLQGDA